jgi:hypothetical protein
MAITYEPIATTTLVSNTTQVDFNSISGSYTDLVLVFNGSVTAGTTQRIRFNSDSSALYSNTRVGGTGSVAYSGRDSGYNFNHAGFLDANDIGMFVAQFMNYANTTTNKTFLSRSGGNTSSVVAWVNLWRSTSAITSISIFCDNTSTYYTSGSTFTLYGIAAA